MRLQNIGYVSNVFARSCHRQSSPSLLITSRLSPFWKHIVSKKHCSTVHSRLTIHFLNHFNHFCGIKTGFPAKTNGCTLFNCFFLYDLWHGQNRQVTSCREYTHCERFELKFDVRGEENLLTNFPKFHGDRATNTMFSQHCRKIYQTDLVLLFLKFLLNISKIILENSFSYTGVSEDCGRLSETGKFPALEILGSCMQQLTNRKALWSPLRLMWTEKILPFPHYLEVVMGNNRLVEKID